MANTLRKNPKKQKPFSFPGLLKNKTAQKFAKGRRALSELATLHELRDEIKLLATYSSDVVYRLRYDTMEYEYISASVERLLGYSAEEMKSTNIRKLILETRMVAEGMAQVKSFDRLESKRREGTVGNWQADYLIKTKGGKKIWVADISYPWFDDKGAIIGSVGSLRDITDRVEAEEHARGEVIRLAHTDAMTGLANRRAFFDRLDDEMKRVRRTRGELSILRLAVDHFKKTHDSYGHDIGDAVLIRLTQIMLGHLRETDFPARLGGEEFGIILPDTPMEGALEVAERIRENIASHAFFGTSGKEPITCTVSIGISGMAFNEEIDITHLYKAADLRLYIAKHSGRNQVSLDELVQVH